MISTVQSAIHLLSICIIIVFTTSRASCWPSKSAILLEKALTKSLNLDKTEYILTPVSNLRGELLEKLTYMAFLKTVEQMDKMARKESNKQHTENKQKPLRKAAGFVIYRKNCNEIIEYLLMQASYENYHWTPPKGHLEKNESDMDAAIRETEEEAGIKVKDISIDNNFEKVLRYEPKDKPFTKQVTYWLARINNPDTPVILSHEHQGYEWLPLKQAKEKAAYPEMQELLDECENYLIKTKN